MKYTPHSHAYSIGRIMCCNFIFIGSPSSFSKVKPGDSEASTLDNKTGLMCRYELSLWSPALLIGLTNLQIIVGIFVCVYVDMYVNFICIKV